MQSALPRYRHQLYAPYPPLATPTQVERLKVFRERVAIVAETGIEELPPDPGVASHHFGDRHDVGTRTLAQSGKGVGVEIFRAK